MRVKAFVKTKEKRNNAIFKKRKISVFLSVLLIFCLLSSGFSGLSAGVYAADIDNDLIMTLDDSDLKNFVQVDGKLVNADHFGQLTDAGIYDGIDYDESDIKEDLVPNEAGIGNDAESGEDGMSDEELKATISNGGIESEAQDSDQKSSKEPEHDSEKLETEDSSLLQPDEIVDDVPELEIFDSLAATDITGEGIVSALVPQFGSNNKFLAPIGAPAENSIPISNREELEAIKDDLNANYHLVADIDLSGEEWVPIGDTNNPFLGAFDGQGHVISSLTITGEGYEYTGLFGYAVDATIKNVGLESVDINIASEGGNNTESYIVYVGGICGNLSTLYDFLSPSSISNCYSEGGTIYVSYRSSGAHIGGICGSILDAAIQNCYNTGDASVFFDNLNENTYDNRAQAGGICGYASVSDLSAMPSAIGNCYNTGGISIYSRESVDNGFPVYLCAGGICGESRGYITACYNKGSVCVFSSAQSTYYAGGICAYLSYSTYYSYYSQYAYTISNCYNEGEIFAESESDRSSMLAGGICGGAEGQSVIKNCKNAGKISGIAEHESAEMGTVGSVAAGGICGESSSLISECCNTGEVTAFAKNNSYDTWASGICSWTYGLTINNCSNTGKISAFAEKSPACAGGICAGFSNSVANNCSNAGEVSTSSSTSNLGTFVGGICGSNYRSAIKNCNNAGTISASVNASEDSLYTSVPCVQAGGICGSFGGLLDDAIVSCHNTGDIFVSGEHISAAGGGICGYINDYGPIMKCYNTGKVSVCVSSANWGSYAGGICGKGFMYGSNTMINNCYNLGEVIAVADSFDSLHYSYAYSGGIGGSGFSISNSYNTGNILASASALSANTSAYSCAGGIGGCDGLINDCYNKGTISADSYAYNEFSYAYASGIISSWGAYCTLTNCYNTGDVSSEATYTHRITEDQYPIARSGGIYDGSASDGSVNNCYCLDLYGSSDGTQLSSEQMKTVASFVGFDFTDIWNIDSSINEGYPYLQACPPPTEGSDDPGDGDDSDHRPNIDGSDLWYQGNRKISIDKSAYYDFFFGPAQAYMLEKYDDLGEGGWCNGMVTTAINIYNSSPSIKSFFPYSYSTLFEMQDVTPTTSSLKISSEVFMTAADYMKYGQVFQCSKIVGDARAKNKNNLQKLYEAVVAFENGITDAGVNIQIAENGAHQVWGVSVDNYNDRSEINVYDCNDDIISIAGGVIRNFRKLILYKDQKGDFSSWEYNLGPFFGNQVWGSGKTASITFDTESQKLYDMLTGSVETYDSLYKLFMSSTPNLKISDPSGHSVSLSGFAPSNSTMLTPIIIAAALNDTNINDNQNVSDNTHLYWMDMGSNLTFSDIEENAKIQVVDNESGIVASVPTNSALQLKVNDDGSNEAIIDLSANDIFSVEFLRSNDDDYMESVLVEGTATNDVVASETSNGIQITGAEECTIILQTDKGKSSLHVESFSNEEPVQIVIDKTGENPIIVNQDDSSISHPTISGITPPVAGKLPVTAIAETNQYTGTVKWSPAVTTFAYDTVYTATITLTPKSGYTLADVPANFFTVSGATATNSANSGIITAVFPKTGAASSGSTSNGSSGGGRGVSRPAAATTSGAITTPGAITSPVENANDLPVPDVSTTQVNPFTDIYTGDWFFDHVVYVYHNRLMNGTSADPMLFRPNVSLTRAMAVTVLYNAAGASDVSDLANPYSDIPADAWYADAVKWAAANGIMSGIGDGKFAPNSPISREQAAVIFYQYALSAGKEPLEAKEQNLDFTDGASISEWAVQGVTFCRMNDVISGKSGDTFDPRGKTTRAEFAAMVHRFMGSAINM